MSSATLKFDGKLIEELSQKIPSSLFALNELIKNSYDAFSPDVKISINASSNTIVISDKGIGMDSADIDKLFHIARSEKSYGMKVEQNGIKRITQGSKGLGFLAAFKFGNEVKWKTCKNGILSQFSLNKSSLVSKRDLSNTKISIDTGTCDKSGTTIAVHSTTNEINELLEDLNDPRVLKKLATTIIDDSFNISIEIENKGEIISTKSLKSFKKENEESQLFFVRYDSKDNTIQIFNKGKHLKTETYELSRTDYSIDIEVVIFHFAQGKTTKSISSLHKRVRDGALYPLVYINNNLFNNDIIFDPEILRKKSSGDSLPQMIGIVNILSQSNDIEFNSDRTNFVDNKFSRDLLKDLKGINERIQVLGSELKKNLKKTSHGKKLPLGKAMPEPGQESINQNVARILIDRKAVLKFYIPSEQIDLKEYIFQIKDSLGQDVNRNDIVITVDGRVSANKILASVTSASTKRIGFAFTDKNTGLVSREIELVFEKPMASISGQQGQQSIFTIPSKSAYKVDLETVTDLINAIDQAFSSSKKEAFLPLIACSIRAIFEICSDKLLKHRKTWFKTINKTSLNSTAKRELKDSLLEKVATIILLLKKNPILVTEISKETEISYSTLNNLLVLSDFKEAVKAAHIGAHQSTRYLSKPKIETSAHSCGLLAVICNVLINLDKQKVAGLSIDSVNEGDFNNSFT